MAVRAQLRARRTGSRSGKFFQGGLGRAVAAAIEPLERRVMLSAAFDTVPPSQPTNLTATPVPQYTDNEIQLNWAASTDNVAVTEYEIFRNLANDPLSAPGVQVGAESAGYTQFIDTGLNPSTSYRYSVIAFDAADNQSSPATVTGTTGADSTAPDAPLDLQVTSITQDPNAPTYSISLSWVQPWDNVGVSGYNVTWSSNASPPTTGSSNPTTPSVKFSGLTAGTTYTFNVSAYDAAQKTSGSVSITASTPPDAAEDQSPNQYVPQVWQDYFYNTLTAALRQKVEALPGGGGSTPAAASWLDLGSDVVFANAPRLASNVVFHDLNGNGLLDPGESAWIPAATNSTGGFAPGDTLVAGPTPTVGCIGNASTLYYVGPNTDGVFDPNVDTLIPDPLLIQGQTGRYDYYDASGAGTWQPNDPVWLPSHPNTYTSGDTVIYDPTSMLQTGMYGKTNGLCYYDAGNSAGPIVWADQTTFRQDFAAFYPAMDALIPHYGSGQAFPNDIWTVAGFLNSLNGGAAAHGTISIGVSQNVVIGADTQFMTEVVAGDYLSIGGGWYQVASVASDTQLTLVGRYSGDSVSGVPLSISNWTKVPGTTDAGTGLTFTKLLGQPDASSLIFPQQFQELHDALASLNQYPARYGMTLFDATSSQQFLASATKAIGVAQSLYGSNGGVAELEVQLELEVRSGDADPGSLLGYSLVVGQLDYLVSNIMSNVYVRAGSGWQMETNAGTTYGPVTFGDYHIAQTLLPANSTPLSHRVAGGWSGPVFAPGQPPIDPIELTEAGTVLDAIIANGLWIADGTLSFSLQDGSVIYRTGVDNDTYVGWAPLDSQANFPDATPPSDFNPIPVLGSLIVGNYQNGAGDPEDGDFDTLYAAGGTLNAILPAPTNPLGGSDLTTPALGPTAGIYNVTNLQWGAANVVESFTAEQILAIIEAHYPPNGDFNNQPTSIPLVFFSTGGGVYGAEQYYSAQVTLDTQDATLFGLVPYEPFTYSPTHSAPTPPSLAPVPTDPLPLTTRMDYLNVMADDGTIDGIVNTAANLSNLGNDTGTATFTARNGTAQVYLPVKTDLTGALPVNGYFVQGGFGAAADGVGDLLSQDVTATNASQDGLSWAYSLDTHVQLNLLVNDANNHFKRVEVIRPGGNAVVFDFAWDSTTGMFSPYGTPEGWSGRDANQTYVLRSLNAPGDDAGLSYELLFANGIVHTFGTGGALQSVSDTSSGLTEAIGGGLPATLLAGTKDTADSPRYNLTLNWSNGAIGSIDYQTTNTTGTVHVIHTAVTYGGDDGNDVTALSKTDDGTPIPQFSYSAISAGSITQNGVTITRSGSVSSGSVTIAMTLPGDAGFASGSSTSETYSFNSHNLVTSDALTLNEGGSSIPTTSTTTYQYQDDSGLYANGSPSWAKVTLVTNPDQSWVGYTYDASTGWVTGTVTPFQSGTWSPGGDTSGDNLESYGYDPSLSGNGQGSDASLLVQPPDTVTDFVLGTQTGETFNNYRTQLYGSPVIVTRQALGDGSPTWAAAGLFSTTTISAFDASSTTSVSGDLSEQKSGNGSGLSYTATSSWFGNPTSSTVDTYNAFGVLTSETADADGQPSTTFTATQSDAFGRTTQASLSGGLSESFNYYSTDWFGPSSVTEADGSTTDYTYTPLGQIATEVDYAGGTYPIKTSFVYDAMGNVVSTKVAPVDGSSSLTDTAAYDAQGRVTQQVSNAGGSDATANLTTSTVYTSDGTYNVTTTTNPDQSTNVEKDYLDGSVASTGGTAGVATSYAYGVVGTDTPDGSGNVETQGSTYATVSTDGGQNTATTYSNVLGQDYLSVRSGPGTSAAASPGQATSVDSLTSFDLNDRPFETVGFDGSKSFDIYDPMTGMVGASWTSMDGSSTFTAGVDSKTVQTLSYGGSDTQLLSTTGVQNDQVSYASGGLTTTDNLNGLITTAQTTMDGNGAFHVTTSNPDGTSQKDAYVSGLLADSQQLGTGGVQIADASYVYNSNRTLYTSQDYTGTTTYGFFQDGTEKSVQAPGQNQPQMVTAINPGTGDPTKVTNSNGTMTSQSENTLGQTATQSGAGVIASKFDYNADGQLTSLTTYPGGDPTNTDDPKAATTTWQYDPATGLMTSKTYNDGSQNTYKYNSAGQLQTLTMPGMSASFGYNAAGIQTSSTAIDSITGLVSSQVNSMDDQGRPVATTSVDNGQVSTETNTYTALGQPQSESFGAAGNASVTHAYYPTTNYGTSGAPAALWSLTVTPPSGPSASQSYTYNSTTQRLRWLTINGLVRFNYGYLSDSNQISSLSVGNVTITFTPDGSNASRVGGIAVTTSGGSTLYNASSISYNQNNQIQSQSVLRTNADGSQSNDNLAYTYGTGTTDNTNDANSLTKVTDNGATTESYLYDGVGNFIGTGLGDANTLNQYAALSYNLRGDVTNDGTYAYTYDANDRMISVTPDAPAQGSLQLTYGYDSQGRRTWKDVYTWNATSSAWVFSYSRSYVYDGTQLVGELDQTGKLVTGYTWSPSGPLLAVTDYTQSTPKTYVSVIDASGNTVMLVDPTAGTVAASYTYDSYGNLLTASGPAQAVCSILGKGLYYDYEARSIGHALSRDERFNTWYERDSAGEILGGANVYSYLGGDPIDLSDTSGAAPESSNQTIAATQWQYTKYALSHPLTYAGLQMNVSGSLVQGNVVGAIDSARLLQEAVSTNYGTKQNEWKLADQASAQGSANAVNGLQDVGVSILNTPSSVYNAISRLAGSNSHAVVIVSSDWSSGIVIPEGANWHGASKFVGGNGIFIAVTAGGATMLVPASNAAKAVALTNTGLNFANGTASGLNAISDFRAGNNGRGAANTGVAVLNLGMAYFGVRSPRRIGVPSAYSVAYETQLAPEQFGLTQEQHFQIANNALRAERAANPVLAELVPEPLRWGRPPASWTWQHATIDQAGGRAGVLQLVPRLQHTPGSPFWPLFHPLPGGAGGYSQWAIPAGAPPR